MGREVIKVSCRSSLISCHEGSFGLNHALLLSIHAFWKELERVKRKKKTDKASMNNSHERSIRSSRRVNKKSIQCDL
jgi:hypothetical protein